MRHSCRNFHCILWRIRIKILKVIGRFIECHVSLLCSIMCICAFTLSRSFNWKHLTYFIDYILNKCPIVKAFLMCFWLVGLVVLKHCFSLIATTADDNFINNTFAQKLIVCLSVSLHVSFRKWKPSREILCEVCINQNHLFMQHRLLHPSPATVSP